MKKTIYALFGVMSLALAGAVTLVVANHASNVGVIKGTDPEYTMTLDSSNAPGELDEGEYTREALADSLIENGDYTLSMSYRLAQLESGHHVLLAPHGSMYNQLDYSDHENKVTGLNYITVNYTSSDSVYVRTSIRNDGKEFSAPVAAVSGTPVALSHSPYYFMIEAGDAEAHIESVVLGYSCQENSGYDLFSLSGKYSGLGNDGYRYVLILNNTSVTVKSLDNPGNVTFNGTASLSNNRLTSSFTVSGTPGTYVCDASADHRQLSFVSKDGACAGFPSIDFYKVYEVEDFESYSATGNAFGGSGRGADSLYSMSGLRAAYHSDWYTTSSSYAVSYLGDSGWKVMGSTDFLTYTSNKGYDGSKAAAFKGNSNGLRYIQFKGMTGLPQIIGKGSYLSFRAKAYSDSSLTTVKATDTAFKAYGFYGQQITKSNLSSIRTSVELTMPANADWTRFTIPLNNNNYYAYGFYLNPSATVYMVVDDVVIYTVDPYEPTPVTGVSISPAAATIETGNTTQLTATVSPIDATNKTINWTSSNDSVAAVNNNGLVTAYTAGNATITATTADGGYTATCAVTVTGGAVAPYPSGSYKGTAVVSGANYDIVLAFGTRSNGLIAVRLSNSDAVATGVTYNDSTQQFTITTTGSYSGYSYGNITGTYDDANDQLTNISCSGQVSAAVSNNGSITATKLTVWDCDGTTSELQSLFKRRYMSGSWQVDTGNADRITSNTEQFVSGTGSVKRRGYSGGAVALNFNADFSPAKTVKNVQFWVYNPSASDITLRMWGYKATNFNTNFETGSVTAKAGQWAYVAMGFTEATIYNWQIADFNNTGVYLSFDNIALF